MVGEMISAARPLDGGDATHGRGDATEDDCNNATGRPSRAAESTGAKGGGTAPLEPSKLLQARATSKRSFTALTKTIRKAIVDGVTGEKLAELERELSALFRETLVLH